MVLLTPAHFCASLQLSEVLIKGSDSTLLEQIKTSSSDIDNKVTCALASKDKAYSQTGNFILKGNSIYVPKDEELCTDILSAQHDTPVTGHLDIYKTHELVLHDFWWPTLLMDMRKYVQSC